MVVRAAGSAGRGLYQGRRTQAGRLERTHTMVAGSPLSFGFPAVAPRAGVRMPCRVDRARGWRQSCLRIAPEAERVSVTRSESPRFSPPVWPRGGESSKTGVRGPDVPCWDRAWLLLLVGEARPCAVATDALCVSTVPPCEPRAAQLRLHTAGRAPAGRDPVSAAGARAGGTGGRRRPDRRCELLTVFCVPGAVRGWGRAASGRQERPLVVLAGWGGTDDGRDG